MSRKFGAQKVFNKETWEKLSPIAPIFYVGMFFDSIALGLSFVVTNSWVDRSLNIMFVLLGMGLSIPVGLLITPLTGREKVEFSSIGKTLLTFASGYLVSNLGDTITVVLSPKYFLTPIVGFRVLAFLICFGVGVPAMYAARQQFAKDGDGTDQPMTDTVPSNDQKS